MDLKIILQKIILTNCKKKHLKKKYSKKKLEISFQHIKKIAIKNRDINLIFKN